MSILSHFRLPSKNRLSRIAPFHCDRMEPLFSGHTLDRFERWIVNKESGGNPLAHNPHSTAFGIGQLLRATRQAVASQFGFDPNTTNIDQQIQMLHAYIIQRYGSTENAYRFWLSHGWY